MNVHVLYVRTQNKQKNIRLSARLYVRGFLAVDTITFEGVIGSKLNLVGVVYV